MHLKITLIGAGSVVFAKNLIGDILQFSELSDCTLCLMDIDASRLKVAEIMATRMVRALKVKAKVVATLDQREAVRGARYVICTIQVGGYKPGTVIDFEIPRKYGLHQTIGDTLGVGGVFRALRTIPVLTRLGRDIAEIGAPGCLLLNYSNPMAMNCMAIAKATGIPHVGLCHSVQGTSQQLASYLGLPYEDISYLVAGINHMAFFLKFEYGGQDAYPLLFDLLAKGFTRDRVRFEMMRRLGYYVTESSEHQSEYTPYFIHHGKELIERFEVPVDEYLRRCEISLRSWKNTEAHLLGQNGNIAVNPQSHEYGSYIIHSCETNTPRVIYGNVPNRHLIDNLPGEACVEVPCLVDAQGIQPTHIGSLPPQLAALCQTNINVQALTVEAALTNRREHIYHAVMLDPNAAASLTLDEIWAMCDDLIAAHQKHGLLGEFAPVVPNTGRAYAGTGDRILAEARLGPPTTATGSLPAEIVVRNLGVRPATVDLSITAVDQLIADEEHESKKVRIKVPAGKTASRKVALPWHRADRDGLMLQLSSDSPGVFTRDFKLRRRPRFAAGGKEGALFELKLAGTHAVDGSLAVGKNVVSLRFAVDDSKIDPCPRPWEGSDIELFVARNDSSPICQLFIVPQAKGRGVKVLDRKLKPVPGLRARIAPRASGYEVNVEVPFSAVDLPDATREFLFDAIVNIRALGDAHSGGRTSISGKLDSHQNSAFFAHVTS